jgi:hypothetical protein
MANLHMEALDDLEVAEVADQALASLNARFDAGDNSQGFDGDLAQELAEAIGAACDAWDRFADLLRKGLR